MKISSRKNNKKLEIICQEEKCGKYRTDIEKYFIKFIE